MKFLPWHTEMGKTNLAIPVRICPSGIGSMHDPRQPPVDRVMYHFQHMGSGIKVHWYGLETTHNSYQRYMDMLCKCVGATLVYVTRARYQVGNAMPIRLFHMKHSLCLRIMPLVHGSYVLFYWDCLLTDFAIFPRITHRKRQWSNAIVVALHGIWHIFVSSHSCLSIHMY